MSTGPAPDFTLSESRPWHRRNLLVLVILALAFIALIGLYECGRGMMGLVKEGIGPSREAVNQFHAHLNRGEYADILAQGTDEFRKSASDAELTSFFDAIHRKLGDFLTASSPSYFVQATTNGTFITLTYESTFQRGKGTEKFVWKMESGKVRLMNYNIGSRELITN